MQKMQRAIKGIEKEKKEQEQQKLDRIHSSANGCYDNSDNNANSLNNHHQEYDALLSEAINLGRAHQAKAKQYVPQMYEILIKKEGLTPADAADRIYKDLVGIWQKDTIRRLLPPETKDQAARERQILSRLKMTRDAGLLMRNVTTTASFPSNAVVNDNEGSTSTNGMINTEHDNSCNGNDDVDLILELQRENSKLKREIEQLADFKRLYYAEKMTKMMTVTAEATTGVSPLSPQQQQQPPRSSVDQNGYVDNNSHQQQQSGVAHSNVHSNANEANTNEIVIFLPPRLFMKTFALMRSYSKPIALKVVGKEVVDLDRLNGY